MCSEGRNYYNKGKKQDFHEPRRRRNTSVMNSGCRFAVVAKKGISESNSLQIRSLEQELQPWSS